MLHLWVKNFLLKFRKRNFIKVLFFCSCLTNFRSHTKWAITWREQLAQIGQKLPDLLMIQQSMKLLSTRNMHRTLINLSKFTQRLRSKQVAKQNLHQLLEMLDLNILECYNSQLIYSTAPISGENYWFRLIKTIWCSMLKPKSVLIWKEMTKHCTWDRLSPGGFTVWVRGTEISI